MPGGDRRTVHGLTHIGQRARCVAKGGWHLQPSSSCVAPFGLLGPAAVQGAYAAKQCSDTPTVRTRFRSCLAKPEAGHVSGWVHPLCRPPDPAHSSLPPRPPQATSSMVQHCSGPSHGTHQTRIINQLRPFGHHHHLHAQHSSADLLGQPPPPAAAPPAAQAHGQRTHVGALPLQLSCLHPQPGPAQPSRR